MRFRTSLQRGLRFTVKPRNLLMLGLLLVVQTLGALLVVNPLTASLESGIVPLPDRDLSTSLQSLVPWMLEELQRNAPTGANAAIGLGVVVYLLVVTFHTGGVLSVMRTTDGTFRFPRFFSGGGIYFLRFARLLLLLLISLFVVNCLLAEFVDPWLEELGEDSRNERDMFYVGLARDFALFLAVVFLLVSFEYARIRTVVLEKWSMVLTTFAAMGFVIRHPIRTMSIFSALFLLDLLLVVAFCGLFRALVVDQPAMILVHLGLTLLLAYLRIGIRVTRLGAEAAYYMSVCGVSAAGAWQADAVAPRQEDSGEVRRPPTTSFQPVGGGLLSPGSVEPGDAMTAPDLEGRDLGKPAPGSAPAPAPVAEPESEPRAEPEAEPTPEVSEVPGGEEERPGPKTGDLEWAMPEEPPEEPPRKTDEPPR